MYRKHWRWVLPAGGILLALSCTLVSQTREQIVEDDISPTAGALAVTESTAEAQNPDYQGQDFSFELPAGWKVHEGSSGTGDNAWNYYALDLTILVEAKGRAYLPQLTVTSREIPPGADLRQVFDQTYAEIGDQINQESEAETVIDGRAGLVKRYNRPWGEPWYTFHDSWVEVNGKIYVISCLLRLNPEPGDAEGCNIVLDSLRFREPSAAP